MDQYWLEVAIDTTPECLDDVAAYLTGCGIVGLSLENEADLNEFMAENKAYWDEVDDALKAAWKGVSRVKFYVTEDEDGKAAGLAHFIGEGPEVAQANGRADGRHEEAEAAPPLTTFGCLHSEFLSP